MTDQLTVTKEPKRRQRRSGATASSTARADVQSGQTNESVALALVQVADLLENHGANPFRVRAYRAAASTVSLLHRPVDEILEAEGIDGLMALPGIGRSLAHSIEQLVESGRLSLLQRLQGHDTAEYLFQTVADIGPKLARRIHEQLSIETLAELRSAALDGRLALVPGMGTKRLQAVRESLTGRFANAKSSIPASASSARGSRATPDRMRAACATDVSVGELLDVDREYRDLAAKGKLPRIAPRRFNPTSEAWLPVLHTQRGDRHYTALYSNTLRAHQMGTTHDWVVIYRDDTNGDGQWTVITATYGELRGCRVVRGLESECAAHYQAIPRPKTQLELFR